MKVYGQLEKAQLEVLSSDPTGYPGRVYFNLVTGKVKYYNSVLSAWTSLGTIAGNGTGNSLLWTNEGPDAALQQIENGQSVFLFSSAQNQQVTTVLRVPLSYVTGNPITAYIGAYSPGTAGTWLLTATSILIRAGIDNFDSTLNSRGSTNSAVLNTSTANKLVVVSLDLTDSSGKINNVAVSAGDLIKISLARSGGSDGNDLRLLDVPSEVAYQ